MPNAQMLGGPDDGKWVKVDLGVRSILIYQGGRYWHCPIRNRRILWNERKEEASKP